MKTYELAYIISSQMTLEEAANVAKEVETVIQSKEGIIVKSEKIFAHALSYPIKKHSSGYFGVVEFQVDEKHLKEIVSFLNKHVRVLRSALLIKKPVKIMKERRTRRLVAVTGSPSEILSDKDKNKGEKVDAADLEKKLDEMLSE